MRKVFGLLFTCCIIASSCLNKISGVKLYNGLYVDSISNEVLDGQFEIVKPIGGTYKNGNHRTLCEYESGIPTGKWEYFFNGDLIHHGEYLMYEQEKASLMNLTQASRVDIEAWYEGDYKFVNIDFVNSSFSIADTCEIKLIVHKIQDLENVKTSNL